MYYTYILFSQSDPDKSYIGCTSNLTQRLKEHNCGQSPHTSKYLPWELKFYAAFESKQKALAFEAYLKSHSGKAFAAKRLL
ncbi:excinuclease ABC subunit C [Coraliomargarita sinensis]|uniref:Excinuclease ABC subunit C n=1 Tax=Coraliomargarita sinensis TaxID=2174842 RepID=A0A317ZD44_9BACT|nr:excinuclease ABC subunit C [Coraliomargarita sinensis]